MWLVRRFVKGCPEFRMGRRQGNGARCTSMSKITSRIGADFGAHQSPPLCGAPSLAPQPSSAPQRPCALRSTRSPQRLAHTQCYSEGRPYLCQTTACWCCHRTLACYVINPLYRSMAEQFASGQMGTSPSICQLHLAKLGWMPRPGRFWKTKRKDPILTKTRKAPDGLWPTFVSLSPSP